MNKYRFKQERAMMYIVHKNQRKKTFDSGRSVARERSLQKNKIIFVVTLLTQYFLAQRRVSL